MGRANRSFRGHLIATLAVVAFAVGWLGILLAAGGGLPSLSSPYRVQAVVPTAASLASNARVTMAGVDVGRVDSVQLRGLGALVKLEIDDSAVTPIPVDSRVLIRQRTPVGENYVSIVPGTSRSTLPSGGILSASEGDDYVDVDQILSVLQGSARARARDLIQSFGGALAGHGQQLNALLGGTTQTLTAGAGVTNLLSADRSQVSRLVQELGDVSRGIGDRGQSVETLARDGLSTFTAIAARDQAMRAMLDELPATLAQVRASTIKLGSVTGHVAPVLANLALALGELRPAVELLDPAAQDGQLVLRALGAAAPPLRATLAQLIELASPLSAAMPALHATLCQLNPAIGYLKPYTPDFVATAVGLGAASKSYDAIGHVLRATPIVTEQALVGLPPQTYQAVQVLVRSGLLRRTRELGYDPYPPPGSIGKQPEGDGLLGPSQVTKPFPRVYADC